MDAFAYYAVNKHYTTTFRLLKLLHGPHDLYPSRIRCKPLSSNVLLLGISSRPPILFARTIKRLLLRIRKCLQRAPKHRLKGAIRDIRHSSVSRRCSSRKLARLPRGQLPDQVLRSKSWSSNSDLSRSRIKGPRKGKHVASRGHKLTVLSRILSKVPGLPEAPPLHRNSVLTFHHSTAKIEVQCPS